MPRALLFLAPGFEEMEAIITIDVLRRAEVEVVTAALGDVTTVTGSHDIAIEADTTLGELSPENETFDAVILPGGMPGSVNLRDDVRVGDWIARTGESGGIVAAICAAPLALAHFGVLTGKNFSSHPSTKEKLLGVGGNYLEERVVVDGRLITSRGPGTAFEFALTLAEILVNAEAAQTLARTMLVKP
jgi:4-methyl-5(b-hydroxyethyl)-thiazole monophosphate biosynthesis